MLQVGLSVVLGIPQTIHVPSRSPWRHTKDCHRLAKSYESKLRTSSTTTRDGNLQFRGAVSTGGSPLDFLLVLQYLCAI